MKDSNLLSCLTAIQEAHDYINELETKVKDLEANQKCTSLLEYIQFSIYRPKRIFTQNKKCSKCDQNGFRKVEDYFYNRSKVCDCQRLEYEYAVEKLNVFSTSCIQGTKEKTYDCVDADGNLISVSTDLVFNTYDDSHKDIDYRKVYYINESDCEALCKKLSLE